MSTTYLNDQRFTIADNIIITELDGESVLLDSTKGQYFGLNHVGSFIIEKIKTGADFASICSAMENHYRIDADNAKQDLSELLTQLFSQDILS